MSGDTLPQARFREVDPSRYVLTTSEEDVALRAAWKVVQALKPQDYPDDLLADTILYLRGGGEERPGQVFSVQVGNSIDMEDAVSVFASISNGGANQNRTVLRAAVETVGIEEP